MQLIWSKKNHHDQPGPTDVRKGFITRMHICICIVRSHGIVQKSIVYMTKKIGSIDDFDTPCGIVYNMHDGHGSYQGCIIKYDRTPLDHTYRLRKT